MTIEECREVEQVIAEHRRKLATFRNDQKLGGKPKRPAIPEDIAELIQSVEMAVRQNRKDLKARSSAEWGRKLNDITNPYVRIRVMKLIWWDYIASKEDAADFNHDPGIPYREDICSNKCIEAMVNACGMHPMLATQRMMRADKARRDVLYQRHNDSVKAHKRKLKEAS